MADSETNVTEEGAAESAAEPEEETAAEEAPPAQEEEASDDTVKAEAPEAAEGDEGAAADHAKEEAGEGETPKQTEEAAEGENASVAAEEGAGGEGGEGEGGEQVEGEQQVDSSEQPAEPSDAVDGEPTEGVAVEPTEGVEQADGEGPSGPAEGDASEAAEGTEPSEQTEEGETAAADVPAEEGSEKPEGGEEEEGGEKVEKPEGEEGEQAQQAAEEGAPAADQEQVDGEAPKEADEETPEAPAVPDVEPGESVMEVGERLSRTQTPEAGVARTSDAERLEATTPDRLGDMAEGDEEQEHRTVYEEEMGVTEDLVVDEPHFRREELIERYHEALSEREQLQQQNYSLQHRLAEYFRKKKADERQDYDKNVTDQEQRYLKYMAQLEDLRRQDTMEKENYRAQIEDAKERCQDKKERVDADRKRFMEFKQHVALNAINSRSGKPIPPKDIEQYMLNEVKKEQEVVNVRLENIKLKNKLKKKEQQLKSKEELAEGLHLIDFEQLKIENQTYNEKIEERNEELLKLRKKITSTVQVLTHLKEKLQFVQGENLEQNNQLKEVEASLAQSRDILSRTKQARDALRIDNQKLRQSCGLLGNESLLRDFEERKDEGDELRGKLEQLKMQHAELTLHCNQVRRKIDQAKQTMA